MLDPITLGPSRYHASWPKAWYREGPAAWGSKMVEFYVPSISIGKRLSYHTDPVQYLTALELVIVSYSCSSSTLRYVESSGVVCSIPYAIVLC